jgi:hypothetical protein
VEEQERDEYQSFISNFGYVLWDEILSRGVKVNGLPVGELVTNSFFAVLMKRRSLFKGGK